MLCVYVTHWSVTGSPRQETHADHEGRSFTNQSRRRGGREGREASTPTNTPTAPCHPSRQTACIAKRTTSQNIHTDRQTDTDLTGLSMRVWCAHRPGQPTNQPTNRVPEYTNVVCVFLPCFSYVPIHPSQTEVCLHRTGLHPPIQCTPRYTVLRFAFCVRWDAVRGEGGDAHPLTADKNA